MPIKIPNRLPATKVLNEENIFVITETRALTQDIRPLKILILNLKELSRIIQVYSWKDFLDTAILSLGEN
mgnify:CR=1 FL=1